jgi:hypothetical protein
MNRIFQLLNNNLLLYAYAILGLLLSSSILLLSFDKGWQVVILYLIMTVVSSLSTVYLKKDGFLVLLLMAPLMGWTSTATPGMNLNIVSGVLSINASLYAFLLARRSKGSSPRLNTIEITLLVFSLMAAVSAVFSMYRVFSFSLLNNGEYQPYPINPLAINSEDVIRHTLGLAANFVSWFGLWLGAREKIDKRRISIYICILVFVLLAVVIIQKYIDPTFLLPSGSATDQRLNSTTSFYYALGALVLFISASLPLIQTGDKLLLPIMILFGITPLIILSGSRLALFSLLLMLVAWGVQFFIVGLKKRNVRSLLKIAFIIIIVVVGLFLLIQVLQSTVKDSETNVFDRITKYISKEGIWGHLYKTRLNAYELAFTVVGKYPLQGVGLGTYFTEITKQIPLLMPADYELTDSFNRRSNAPSLYLAIATEIGIPALIVFLLFCLQLTMEIIKQTSVRGVAVGLGVLTVFLAFNIGPELYNSEVIPLALLLFAFLSKVAPEKRRELGFKTACYISMGLQLVGILLFSAPLAIDSQWAKLKWPMEEGFYRAESTGRWTSDFATWLVPSGANTLTIHWYTGSPKSKLFKTTVTFSVNGSPIRIYKKPAPGKLVRTDIKLPETTSSYHSISVTVSPAFIPADNMDSLDNRKLGIFIKAENIK